MNNEEDEYLIKFFKELGESNQAPDEIKKAVFSHLDSFELITNMFDLFTMKFTNTQIDFIGSLEKKDDKT
jgi:hypothetical protein